MSRPIRVTVNSIRSEVACRSHATPPAHRPTDKIVPQPPSPPVKREVSCFVPSNFHTLTERLDTLVADLPNQFPRDPGHGAAPGKPRDHVGLIAQVRARGESRRLL